MREWLKHEWGLLVFAAVGVVPAAVAIWLAVTRPELFEPAKSWTASDDYCIELLKCCEAVER